MLYATGYRQDSKLDKVEYIYKEEYDGKTEAEQDQYIELGDDMYELKKTYSSTGALLYDHPYNVSDLYSLGSPYNGTEMNNEIARGIKPDSFKKESAKNILDATIQNEIRNNWNAACVVNPKLKLHAYAGETSLNFIIGLLAEDRSEIAAQLQQSLGNAEELINGFCVEARAFLVPFKEFFEELNKSCNTALVGSLLLPWPFSMIVIGNTAGLKATVVAARNLIEEIEGLLNEIQQKPTAEEKLLIVDEVIYSFSGILNIIINDILPNGEGYQGINSIGDIGDFFISTDSQLAEGYSNVETYKKVFDYKGLEVTKTNGVVSYQYERRNFNFDKRMLKGVAIPHNLETYDEELQNEIRMSILFEKVMRTNGLSIRLVKYTPIGNWGVKITNTNDKTVTVTYNERMCFEDDAKNFHHLTNLRSFRLAPKASRTMDISGFGTADYITICTDYELSNGLTAGIVAYADKLNPSDMTMDLKWRIFAVNGGQEDADFVPSPLDLQVASKSGSTWSIRLVNPNPEDVSVTYNSKMCFDDAARNFYGLRDLVDVVVPANSSKTVTIEENWTADYITAAINFKVDGVRYRLVSSANGLTDSGGINALRYHEVQVSSQFPQVTTPPSYVTLMPVSRSGFLYYTWGIKITNNNNFAVEVSYNAKLCFENDAKTFSNLADIVTVTVPAKSSKTVTINHNGTAGWIVASVNYSYEGYEYRRITYADGLNINPYRTNTAKHNQIRFT